MNTVDILGIDLGTTKSVIAVWEPDTGARILPNREHEPITPSVVTFDPETGQAVVGQPAIEFMLCHPDDVIYSVKRFIGRTPDDQWVRYDREHVTYPITTDNRHKVVVHAEGRELTPTQVSAEVLRKLKEDAQVSLGGRPITQAVISVPAYFNVSQQRATKEAGELAGLSVPRIVPEPTAAALAFNLGEEPQTVAVYDLGGGTFDISILRVERGLFRVKAIGGDTHLGGDDFDQAIVNWLQNLFEYQHPRVTLPVAQDHRLRARLREAAKQAKVALTDTLEYAVQLPDLLTVAGQTLGLEATLTREKLEELIRPLIEQSLQLVDKTLVKASLKKEAIDQILLVGGQTRMPAVKEAIRQRYRRPVNDTISRKKRWRGEQPCSAPVCAATSKSKSRYGMSSPYPWELNWPMAGLMSSSRRIRRYLSSNGAEGHRPLPPSGMGRKASALRSTRASAPWR